VKKTSKRTSSSPKRSPRRSRASAKAVEPAAQALVDFAALADRQRIRWYVFGAEAVNLYGFPRKTADLDLTIDLGERKTSELVPQLERAGFQPRFSDEAFIRATRVIPVVHLRTTLPVDLVLAGPGLEQLFLDSVTFERIAGTRIPVIAPEHLIVTKVLAARPKDLEDVRELVAIRTIDRREVVSLLREIEAALGQSDLVSKFSAATTGLSSRRGTSRRGRR
jgi:hypothetical protein